MTDIHGERIHLALRGLCFLPNVDLGRRCLTQAVHEQRDCDRRAVSLRGLFGTAVLALGFHTSPRSNLQKSSGISAWQSWPVGNS